MDGRYYPLKKRVTPYIAEGGGYALSWLDNTPGTTFTKGGVLAYSQLGIRIYISKNVAWIFGLGYRFQQGWASQIFTDVNGNVVGEREWSMNSHFFTVKTGFTF